MFASWDVLLTRIQQPEAVNERCLAYVVLKSCNSLNDVYE